MRDLEGLCLVSVLVATIMLIARWRARGAFIAIAYGYAAIHVINISFPHDLSEDIEFARGWPILGFFVMAVWSLFVLTIILFGLSGWDAWKERRDEKRKERQARLNRAEAAGTIGA